MARHAVDPTGIDPHDPVLASATAERHRSHRAALKIGAHHDRFIEGFGSHLDLAGRSLLHKCAVMQAKDIG
jgi:hypothetical protein